MSAMSLAWALSGQALDGVGDPHLQPGMHYRLLLNPLLGLPVAPLTVGKIHISVKSDVLRHDIVWIDSRQVQLTEPFEVTADNPVTGYLPTDQTCCWASLRATAKPRQIVPGRPRVADPTPIRPEMVIDPRARRDLLLRAGSGLQVTALVSSAQGDAPVAVKSRAPYHVYASHIQRIVVTGTGTVTGLDWLPAQAVKKYEPLGLIPLPTGPGARYVGPADGYDQGLARVKAGAPQRLGMHECPNAAGPSVCDPVDRSDEVARIEKVHAELADALDRVVNDTSETPWNLTSSDTLTDATGRDLGKAEHHPLWDLFQATMDPGYARMLGLLGIDETSNQSRSIVVYVIEGLFSPDFDALEQRGLLKALEASGAVFPEATKPLSMMSDTAPDLYDYVQDAQKLDGRFLLQRVVLAATEGNPLDDPSSAVIEEMTPGAWLPSVPPDAVREVSAALERLLPGTGLASAIGQPSGTPFEARNRVDDLGRGRLLGPQPAADVPTPTSGRLADRGVDERSGSWRIAQLDWFGRWSPWATATIAAGVRPGPPRPVLTVTAAPPSTVTGSGPLAGTVRIEAAVPPLDGLPTGALLLKDLELTIDRGAGPVASMHALPSPSSPPPTLVVEVPGPALLPTAVGSVSVTGRWVDSSGVASAAIEPKRVTFHDPRAPAPVALTPGLTYTSRPDATGNATTTLTWASTSDQAGFRVFGSDETMLRAKLSEVAAGNTSPQAPTQSQAQALLAALDAAADDPVRAGVWETNRHLLPRRWWLQLTPELIPGGGQVSYTHAMSGSLQVLALYRVVAVSTASVESDFTTSALLARRVPNMALPPVPTLLVEPVYDGVNLHARLTITVPVGSIAAARYRVRRATANAEPDLMPIVAEGPVGPAAPGTAQQVVVVDTGTTAEGPRTSLNPWLGYTWRVEVRAGAAPGGGPVGEWTAPSDPASFTTMPALPPVAVTSLTVTRSSGDVRVKFKHPDPLHPGGSTGYVIDVYRQLPGQSLTLWQSLAGQTPPRKANPSTFYTLVDSPGPAPGTVYRVVVTDPIGRTSPVSPPVEAP